MRTAPPPPRSPAPPGHPPSPASPAPPSPTFGSRLGVPADTTSPAAELAVVGLTVAAVVGLGRLFTDASFLPQVLTVVLAGHAVAWGARRLGLGPVGAVVVSVVGLLLAVGWVVEPGTTTFGLPLGSTWQAIDADLRAAWEAFGEVRAPTAVTRGFVLAAAIGGWVAAFAADTFAFRARTRVEAVVPSFVLFLFGALIGAERNRLATTALYLTAVLVFVVLSEASRRSGSSWFAGRSADGERALVRSGLTMALGATVAALVVGPRLPGAGSPGVVDWLEGRERGSSSPRVTVSPLVDIRARLLDPSNEELFNVRSTAASYWRLTSLERYDGTIWSSSGSYEPARGRLPAGVPTSAPQDTVVQHFEIRELSTPWLPAAYRPQRLAGPRGVRFDPDSSSLLTDGDTPNGMRYSVQSSLAQLDGDDLAGAPAGVPPDVAKRYQALPDDFPDDVRREAFRVTAADAATCQRLGCSPAERASGRLSPFHAARALQDHFRTNFRYSLNVRTGHDERALQEFLFETRRGYCEQFAGSFAAMARAIGLPSRVAVGFAPGTPTADDAFRVTAKEAHAWPEVYLAGFGWVAFEPTPSRALPGAESYTGVTGPSAAAAPGDSSAPATTAPSTVAPAPAPEASPDDREEPAEPTGGLEGTGRTSPVPAFWPLVLAAAAVAYLAVVPSARRVLRRRRRAAAATPTERVLVAWQEAEEDLALAGLGRRPAETGPEYARRLESATGADGSGARGAEVPARMAQLAHHRSAAAFSPAGADEATARQAEVAAGAVSTALRARAGPAARVLWSLHPRPLVEAVSEAVQEKRKSLADRRSGPQKPPPTRA